MHFQKLASTIAMVLAGQGLLPAVAQSEILVRMETSLGNIDIELFDQGAPVTVTNFMNYVRRGDYDNSFIHRSALNPYIIQGGGYIYENGDYSQVPTDPPIVNEYDGVNRPNQRDTLAMAKIAGNPNSATSQWFFNIGDNSGTLGAFNNGGFTVFGRVVGSNSDNITTNDGASMQVVDAIAGLNRFNRTGIDPDYDAAWTELPLIGFIPGQTPYDPLQHSYSSNQSARSFTCCGQPARLAAA